MFELFFIIIFKDETGYKERFPDSFMTKRECISEGWRRAEAYTDEIKSKYPNMTKFDIECNIKLKDTIQI